MLRISNLLNSRPYRKGKRHIRLCALIARRIWQTSGSYGEMASRFGLLARGNLCFLLARLCQVAIWLIKTFGPAIVRTIRRFDNVMSRSYSGRCLGFLACETMAPAPALRQVWWKAQVALGFYAILEISIEGQEEKGPKIVRIPASVWRSYQAHYQRTGETVKDVLTRRSDEILAGKAVA